MKKAFIGLFSLFLLLAQFALPAGTLAAPAMTVSPTSGPRGTAIGISARDLSRNTDHLVQLVRGAGNTTTTTTRLFEERTRSDARGEIHYRLAVNQEPGAYTLRIAAIGGRVLATARFTVTASPSANVTVSPGSGPRGTAIGVSARGLSPATDHLVQLVRGSGNTNTVRLFEDRTPSDARGELHYRLAVNQEPGAYTVRIVALGGTVLATAPFTVTNGGSPTATPTPPPGGSGDSRYFSETDQTVRGRFLAYWRAHGLDLGDRDISERESLALFGYPISGEFEQRLENGRTYTVQYFERARMEYHPENAAPYDVLLGQFGRRILATVPNAPITPVADARRGRFFPETGHNVLDGAFLDFWQANGGLAVFGYPLSEEFEQHLEIGGDGGRRYKVQYFERARFEYHPELAGSPYEVILGQFGRQILGPTECSPAPRC